MALSDGLRDNQAVAAEAIQKIERNNEDLTRIGEALNQAEIDRDEAQFCLKLLSTLSQARFVTRDWDQSAQDAYEIYVQTYDRIPKETRQMVDHLLEEMEQPTAPELREIQQDEFNRQETERQRQAEFEDRDRTHDSDDYSR